MRGLKKYHHRLLVNRAERRVIAAHRDATVTPAELHKRLVERERLLGEGSS